jgi:hypothetical protein
MVTARKGFNHTLIKGFLDRIGIQYRLLKAGYIIKPVFS